MADVLSFYHKTKSFVDTAQTTRMTASVARVKRLSLSLLTCYYRLWTPDNSENCCLIEWKIKVVRQTFTDV
jgi:hypothetical protein